VKYLLLFISLTVMVLTGCKDNDSQPTTSTTPPPQDNGNAGDAPAAKAYTMWWVIFNNPDQCVSTSGLHVKCGMLDIFGQAFLDSVGSGAPDPGLIAPNFDSGVGVIYATGSQTDDEGKLSLAASIYQTPANSGLDLPAGIDPLWLSTGFESSTAEVHLVVRSHGEALEGEAGLSQLLGFLDAYCYDPNLLYYSGANLCQDEQFAAFGQEQSGTHPMFFMSAPDQEVEHAEAHLIRHENVLQAIINTQVEL
jgi:hypothetical protein